MKSKKVANIAEVSKDIIGIKFRMGMTLNQCYMEFYKVMLKHGIKKGTKTKTGISGNNFEWTICLKLFQDHLNSYHNWQNILVSKNMPKELEY